MSSRNGGHSSFWSGLSKGARVPVSEEPLFAHSSTGLTLAEEFSCEESIALPNINEFFPKKQCDPWRRLSALEHDCILVVEFSELEGPKPSMCIPDSPGAHFERNDFAVWLMTADYQASNHRNGPFNINDDIQMLVSNEEQGVHTYAHHFTLFDIEARGYVRPFCATYVTPDPDKLTVLFDALRSEFSKILKLVKVCNRRQFRKALSEAAEALQVIETQAISSYYELYYDGKLDTSGVQADAARTVNSNQSSPSHAANSKQEKPDVLNTRYRRLQQELELAQHAVSEDLRSRFVDGPTASTSNGLCSVHVVNMDQWINSLRRGEGLENHKKTLKELCELSPCAFGEFQRQLRSVWMKFRHWESTAAWFLERPFNYQAKINLGSIPILYLPQSVAENGDHVGRKRRRDGGRRSGDYLISEIDALHGLVHWKQRQRGAVVSSDDQDRQRLLVNVAPHLRYFLYPVLTGQLLIAYGGDLRRQLIVDLIQKLKYFIPTIFSSPPCSVWNDDASLPSGRIPESALSDYKAMGLRVGQKETVSNFISEEMRRYVALLDLNNDVFHVADYKGDILNRLVNRASSHKSDWTLTVTIFSVLSEYASLAYVHRYSNFPISNNGAANGAWSLQKLKMTGGSKWKEGQSGLGLPNGDWKIVRYLVELLKLQQEENDEDGEVGVSTDKHSQEGLLLEYEPAHAHKM